MAETALQVVPQQQSQLAKPETFAPRTLDEAMKFADIIKQSGMLPKSYADKPAAAIVVALQFGMELGLQPMQSLQNIANINGQPSIWGDAALALVLNSGLCEYYQEDNFETIKKNSKATFVVKRRGFPKETVTTFSYQDAKDAGIFTNAVWKTYPYRMCQMRARSFGLRDTFPDVLKGLVLAEEVMDYPGQTIEGQAGAGTTPAQAEKAEDVIGTEKATEFYKAYKAHGWTAEESKKFLKETFGIEAPRTSKDIPASKLKDAMDWANMNAPIRDQAVKLFADLAWTKEEAEKFINEQKWNWTAIVDALSAELSKRNAQEQ